MATGYKDFLSSPFFPRYGTIVGVQFGPYYANNGDTVDLGTIYGHLIVKDITFIFYTYDDLLGTGFQFIIDGTIFDSSIEALVNGYGYTFTDALGVKILRSNVNLGSWSVGTVKDIHVGSSLQLKTTIDGASAQIHVDATVSYYPVE